jgi:PAS domain S-box-containing protein
VTLNPIVGQANVLYDLAKDSRLDGLIIWNAGLTVCLSQEEVERFCKQFHIPVITLEGRVSGLTCVSYDNYQGMRSAIEHLIDVHGYRKIGFLGMYEHHTGFQERYRGYIDAMRDHGLPIDPRLAKPWFPEDRISLGMIDGRVLATYLAEASSLGMEAVIGIADSIVLQVQSTLQERGVRVPGDVAVVGFDDSAEGRVLTPPLTTVKPSWYEFGHSAAEALIDLLAGKPAPEEVNVPTVLMVRQSCGCRDPYVAAAAAEPFPTPQAASASDTESIRREIEPLSKAFTEELAGGKAAGFLDALEAALQRSTAAMEELSYWHNALVALRRQILPRLKHDGPQAERAETLLQQAHILISRIAERTQMLRGFRAAEKELDFQRVSVSLLTTLDLATLMDTLANELPRLGIPGCYLSLFENPRPYTYPDAAPEWARLILAYGPRGRARLESSGLRFPAKQLIPDKLWPRDRACSFVLLSLRFQEEQMGFVVFESGSRNGRMYETLRTQISSALQGALLMQRVQERSAELARHQYILDAFMENVPDHIYFKDLDSRFTRANKAHAVHLGLDDPAEEIGKSDLDYFPPEQARKKYEQEQEILRTGKPLLNLEEPDGIGCWALTTKMPLRDERGEIMGTFGISRDITALKEAQAALELAYAEVERQVQERTAELRQEILKRRQAEEEVQRLNAGLEQRVVERTAQLQAANKELEAFSYSVSHDLRAPLRAMDGFSRILLQDYAPQLVPDAARHLATIRESCQQMGRLIDDLLAFSRLGRQTLSKQPIDTAALVRQVLDSLGSEREGRRVEVSIDDLPVCRGDPALLRQVWHNLLSNAFKFTRGRETARIEIGCAERAGEQVYFIKDNGVGFDTKYADKLFGVFQRLHRDDEFEGSGIGLAIVQRIVLRHGGRVWAKSKLGVGSTFYFTI